MTPFTFEPSLGRHFTYATIEGSFGWCPLSRDRLSIYIDVIGKAPRGTDRVCIDDTADPFWKAVRTAIVEWLNEHHADDIAEEREDHRQGAWLRQRSAAREAAE